MEKNNKKGVSSKFIAAWSTQSVSYAIHLIAISYLTYFCTNGLGMNAALVGIIMLICKLLDGLADIVGAVVIERTNTKFGKGRPYSLLMPIAWVLTIFLFSIPATMGNVGKTIFIFLFYFLISSVCLTLTQGAEPVYLSRSLKNNSDSSTVLSIGGLLSGFGGLIFGILFPVLVSTFAGKPHGWTIIIGIMAIPGLILSTIRFLMIKERSDIQVANQSGEKFGIKDVVSVLKQNKHVFILLSIGICSAIYSQTSSTVMTYYFQYIMGDIGKQSIVNMVGLIGMLSLLVIPALIKRFSLKKVMISGMIIAIIGSFLRTIPIIPIQMLSYLLGQLGSLPVSMLLPSMLIDCMDYHEWKTGKRVEAVFSAVQSFSQKIGIGLASAIIGFVMGISGFDGNLATQSANAKLSIVGLYAYLPVVLFVLIFILLRIYPLDKQMNQVRKDLEERRSNNKI